MSRNSVAMHEGKKTEPIVLLEIGRKMEMEIVQATLSKEAEVK